MNHSLFYEYSGRFLKMAKKSGRPFFFMANTHDPHRPFVGTVQDSILVEKKHHSLGKKFSPSEIYVPAFLPDLPDIRKEVAQYYGSVNRADKNIGAVLQALKESGLADNTLIIFLSDHGASLPFGKSQCYLNSNKTPFILKWPGQVKGGSIDSTHFISAIDVMPTILELLSLPDVPDMDGKSFLPVLQGKRQKERKHVFTTYYQTFAKTRYPMRCIQSERYGYIYNFWSDGKLKMTGDATGGLTWNAMLKAEKTDPSIAARVELYRHRMREEFYDFSKPAYPGCCGAVHGRSAEKGIKDRSKQGIIVNEPHDHALNNLYSFPIQMAAIVDPFVIPLFGKSLRSAKHKPIVLRQYDSATG